MPESIANFIASLIPFSVLVIISFPIWTVIDKHQNTPSKFKRFCVWFLAVVFLPGIISSALTNVTMSIWTPIQDRIVNFLTGTCNHTGIKDNTDTNAEFEKYISFLSDEMLQYSSLHYGLKIVIPYKYDCKSFALSSERNPEERIELYYDDMELELNITICDGKYNGFQSVDSYYEYYQQIYRNEPNIYAPLYKKADPPYCVFSFNSDIGKEIYYELTYNLDGIWCVSKFTYPTNNREICNTIVENYVKTAVLSSN